jgi:hypothetical protein
LLTNQKLQHQKPQHQKPQHQKPQHQKPQHQKPQNQKPQNQKPQNQKPQHHYIYRELALLQHQKPHSLNNQAPSLSSKQAYLRLTCLQKCKLLLDLLG